MDNLDLVYLHQSGEVNNIHQEISHDEKVKNTIDKVNNTFSNQLGTFSEIARGAIKIVWIKKDDLEIPHSDSRKTVLYTAQSSFFEQKEKELIREVETMKKIDDAVVTKKSGSTAHLAVGANVLPKEQQIQGRYTVEVDQASRDFEKQLRNRKMPFENRIKFGADFLNGLMHLHGAQFAYGDMKPENLLIYEIDGIFNLKISDFGKTEEIKPGETLPYKGNTRFAPPEGVLTQKGDVYSAAMVLIRDFEGMFLDQHCTTLVEVDQANFDMEASEGLEGIEKFVVEHKAFLACNRGGLIGVVRRLKMGTLSENERQTQQTVMHEYINELEKILNTNRIYLGIDEHQISAFCALLKQMTLSNPDLRPTAENALTMYNKIFNPAS